MFSPTFVPNFFNLESNPRDAKIDRSIMRLFLIVEIHCFSAWVKERIPGSACLPTCIIFLWEMLQ